MDNTFMSVMLSVDRMQSEWDRTKHGSGFTNSVIGLWKEGRQLHHFLRQYKRDVNAEFTELSRKFESGYAYNQRREFEEKLENANRDIRRAYKKDIDDFIRTKERLLDTMLVTPPSEKQMQLLESLQLRGNGISKGEAFRIAPFFFNNFNALKGFQHICDTAGLKVHFPLESDSMELYGELAEMRREFMMIADQIGSASPDWMAGSFFFINPQDPDEIPSITLRYSKVFDVIPQLQTYDKKSLSAADRQKVETLFRDIKDLDEDNPFEMFQIEEKTERIIEDHKEEIPIILSTEYGKYVRMVWDLKKARASAEEVKASSEAHHEAVNEAV